MPQKTYEVTAPDGRVLELTGDHAPTEAELSEIFKSLRPNSETPKPASRKLADAVVDALPVAGATAGGLIGASGGGIMAVPGAGVGGMVGDALKQGINALRGAPPAASPVGELAGQTALSAAVQAGPTAIAGAARMVAPALMRTAIGNTAATLARKPDVAQTALNAGATVSRAGVHKLDDMLANRSLGLADKQALKATRDAIAEQWKSLSGPERYGLWAATGGRVTPAVESALAQGLWHAASWFAGVSPIALRAGILALSNPSSDDSR